MKRTFVLTSLLAFAALSPNDSGYGASPSPDAAGLCVPVRGSFCGEKVPESPDPLVACRWERPLASDDLEHYELHPLSIEMRTGIRQNAGASGPAGRSGSTSLAP